MTPTKKELPDVIHALETKAVRGTWKNAVRLYALEYAMEIPPPQKDEEIAARLLSPARRARKQNGKLMPSKYATWLGMQDQATREGYRLLCATIRKIRKQRALERKREQNRVLRVPPPPSENTASRNPNPQLVAERIEIMAHLIDVLNVSTSEQAALKLILEFTRVGNSRETRRLFPCHQDRFEQFIRMNPLTDVLPEWAQGSIDQYAYFIHREVMRTLSPEYLKYRYNQ